MEAASQSGYHRPRIFHAAPSLDSGDLHVLEGMRQYIFLPEGEQLARSGETAAAIFGSYPDEEIGRVSQFNRGQYGDTDDDGAILADQRFAAVHQVIEPSGWSFLHRVVYHRLREHGRELGHVGAQQLLALREILRLDTRRHGVAVLSANY